MAIIILLVLAVLMTLVAVAITFVVLLANSMSDAPTMPFEGGSFIAASWVAAAGLWAWWIFS